MFSEPPFTKTPPPCQARIRLAPILSALGGAKSVGLRGVLVTWCAHSILRKKRDASRKVSVTALQLVQWDRDGGVFGGVL